MPLQITAPLYYYIMSYYEPVPKEGSHLAHLGVPGQVGVQVGEAVKEDGARVVAELQPHPAPNAAHPPRTLKHFGVQTLRVSALSPTLRARKIHHGGRGERLL